MLLPSSITAQSGVLFPQCTAAHSAPVSYTHLNGPQPNMDILLACYRASAESVRNGRNRYAIDRAMLGLDDQQMCIRDRCH